MLPGKSALLSVFEKWIGKRQRKIKLKCVREKGGVIIEDNILYTTLWLQRYVWILASYL